MICPGGNVVEIKEGYWRKHTETSTILPCFNNRENCKGGRGADLCKDGHTGGLCEACDYYGPIRYAHTCKYIKKILI